MEKDNGAVNVPPLGDLLKFSDDTCEVCGALVGKNIMNLFHLKRCAVHAEPEEEGDADPRGDQDRA